MSRKVIPAKPRSNADIEAFALSILRRYQPEALAKPTPFDIERFFECELERLTGVLPDYRPLPIGIFGYTDSDEMESVISSELMDDAYQLKFTRSTMAHETGHALLHVEEFRLKKAILRSIHNKQHVSLRMYRESAIRLYKNPEWQAWRFAGCLLMPASMVKTVLGDGCSVRAIAEIFEVNPAFVRTRLRGLKILNVPE